MARSDVPRDLGFHGFCRLRLGGRWRSRSCRGRRVARARGRSPRRPDRGGTDPDREPAQRCHVHDAARVSHDSGETVVGYGILWFGVEAVAPRRSQSSIRIERQTLSSNVHPAAETAQARCQRAARPRWWSRPRPPVSKVTGKRGSVGQPVRTTLRMSAAPRTTGHHRQGAWPAATSWYGGRSSSV